MSGLTRVNIIMLTCIMSTTISPTYFFYLNFLNKIASSFSINNIMAPLLQSSCRYSLNFKLNMMTQPWCLRSLFNRTHCHSGPKGIAVEYRINAPFTSVDLERSF